MSFNLTDALANGGKLAVCAALVVGSILGAIGGEQARPVDTISDVASSPAEAGCPGGWIVTKGDDPHAGAFTACASPDGRYIMRISDGSKTTLDQQTGQFVDSGQFK